MVFDLPCGALILLGVLFVCFLGATSMFLICRVAL